MLLKVFTHDRYRRDQTIKGKAVIEHEIHICLDLEVREILSSNQLFFNGGNIHGILDHIKVSRNIESHRIYWLEENSCILFLLHVTDKLSNPLELFLDQNRIGFGLNLITIFNRNRSNRNVLLTILVTIL